MNITVEIDDELLARVQEVAERRGTTVDEMIRENLEKLAPKKSPEEALRELRRLWDENPGDSGGERWTREELYDRRILR